WSHAVLRVLETRAYAALDAHQPGFIARRLGISEQDEVSCLNALRAAGQIRRQNGRYVVCELRAVDTRGQTARAEALRAFWLGVARERHERRLPGIYSYNVCSVSEADY